MTTPATVSKPTTKRIKTKKVSAKSALTERDQLLRRYLKQQNLKEDEMKAQKHPLTQEQVNEIERWRSAKVDEYQESFARVKAANEEQRLQTQKSTETRRRRQKPKADIKKAQRATTLQSSSLPIARQIREFAAKSKEEISPYLPLLTKKVKVADPSKPDDGAIRCSDEAIRTLQAAVEHRVVQFIEQTSAVAAGMAVSGKPKKKDSEEESKKKQPEKNSILSAKHCNALLLINGIETPEAQKSRVELQHLQAVVAKQLAKRNKALKDKETSKDTPVKKVGKKAVKKDVVAKK